MRPSDFIFARLKTGWLIICAIFIPVCLVFHQMNPAKLCEPHGNGDAIAYLGEFVQFLSVAGLLLFLWSLAKTMAGLRNGQAGSFFKSVVAIAAMEVLFSFVWVTTLSNCSAAV